jgi:hypothetical protein
MILRIHQIFQDAAEAFSGKRRGDMPVFVDGNYFSKLDSKLGNRRQRLKLNSKNEIMRAKRSSVWPSRSFAGGGLANAAEHLKTAEEYRRVFEKCPRPSLRTWRAIPANSLQRANTAAPSKPPRF